MESDNKLEQIENDAQPVNEQDEIERAGRRKFLRSLGKWSMAVIGGVVGAAALPREASAWINRRGVGGVGVRGGSAAVGAGGGWVNRRGAGGWLNAR
jgi:hypothetical protein